MARVVRFAACSILLIVLAACAPSPTPVLIPSGPTAVVTPGANPTVGITLAARVQPPTAVPSSTLAPLVTTTTTPRPAATASVAPPAPTSTLPPTNAPIAISPPTSTAAPTSGAPIVFNFSITPTTTQRIGDRLTMKWRAAGDQAAVCPLFGLGPDESQCADVPPSGSRTVSVDESMLEYTGFVLRVTSGTNTSWATVMVALQCQGLRDWFFPNPPARCPSAPVETSEAAAQPFEHGLMIWTKTSDTFYVFLNGEGDNQVFEFASHVRLKPGASPNNRVGGEPAGRIDPVSGFGMLWRGEFEEFSNVRARLGWGLLPEFAYTSAYQCELGYGTHLWVCYLRVPDNKVLKLRPDSTAQVHYLWRQLP